MSSPNTDLIWLSINLPQHYYVCHFQLVNVGLVPVKSCSENLIPVFITLDDLVSYQKIQRCSCRIYQQLFHLK